MKQVPEKAPCTDIRAEGHLKSVDFNLLHNKRLNTLENTETVSTADVLLESHSDSLAALLWEKKEMLRGSTE